jgi:hypothetical protein
MCINFAAGVVLSNQVSLVIGSENNCHKQFGANSNRLFIGTFFLGLKKNLMHKTRLNQASHKTCVVCIVNVHLIDASLRSM